MSNVNIIKASYLCYGCGACNVMCGNHAIIMSYDNIGRLVPSIDETKCTNCGICYAHCPSLDLKGIQLPKLEDFFVGNVEKVSIGRATEKRIYENSQSGGMVTATVKYLFESGKIDAAIMCRVDDSVDYNPKAVVITSPEELYSCQKSSYVPIDIVSALSHIEQFDSIAVVGTGCNIQGIKAVQNFKLRYKEKIKYLLGLICDRTLCKTATDVIYGNYFKEEEKRLIWRDKSLSYQNARVLIETPDQRSIEVPTWKRFALKDPFTNPRCRICFDKLNTSSDIVFGDPWGMSNVDWENGMSVIMIRTSKGRDIIKEMLNCKCVELIDAPLTEVVKGQLIAERKRDVSSALLYYKKHNWLIPSYYAEFPLSQENLHINMLIDGFVNDAALSKDEIVKKNKKHLAAICICDTIKKSIRLIIGKKTINFVKSLIKIRRNENSFNGGRDQ